jgi:hypothetical protein
MESEKIKQLARALLNARYHEHLATAARIKAEDELAYAIGNDKIEGSKTFKNDQVSISVTNRLTRKLDYAAYKKIRDQIPEGCDFVEYQPKINLAKLRHIEATMPALAAQCITTKPAKSSIRAEVL